MGKTEGGFLIEGLAPDDTVLVSGPPMTGKYHLSLQLLSSYADNVILISTKNSAARIIDDFRDVAGDVPEDRLGVIDCVSHNDAIDGPTDSLTVKYAKSPNNLTQIGVQFTELTEVFEAQSGHTGTGIHSLSQLVMHSDMKNIYQFLQVLTGQIRSAGWFGVAVIDTTIDTEEELRILHHHFDGVIETREDESDGRQYRVRGLSPTVTDWTSF